MIRQALALALLPGAALAEMQVQTVSYACERGVEVPVVYVNDPDQSLAVLTVDSRQILLYAEAAGSSGRCAWPSDGSGYVWATEGTGAILYWRDAAAGTEMAILTACVQQ